MDAEVGLLSPVTVGHDELVSDGAVLDALVEAEIALIRALADVGIAPPEAADAVAGAPLHGVVAAELARAAVTGGNPVIPLVPRLRERAPGPAKPWVHRGATSQDILDTAMMLVAHRALAQVLAALVATEAALITLAESTRDEVAAARTLTQHAVPTTVGARVAGWLRAVRRAADRLGAAREDLPAQLGGAAGTLASFVQLASDALVDPEPAARLRRAHGSGATAEQIAASLPGAFAARVELAVPSAPWHTQRAPITELGDALVQVLDALGKIAADVATLSRTEIAEVAEASGGGSSAMPQKQNPAEAVLIRSAALRAPQLGATLHLASALAVDERPDGAWHAEWPTLRELLRLALGASAHAASLAGGLRVETAGVAQNLARTRGLLVAERLSVALGPRIGAERVRAIVAAVGTGEDLREVLRSVPEVSEADLEDLCDPARYTGLARTFTDEAVGLMPDSTSQEGERT